MYPQGYPRIKRRFLRLQTYAYTLSASRVVARSRGALIRRHSWKERASDDYDEVLWYIARECSLISRRTGWCRGATAPTRVEGFPCRLYAHTLARAHTHSHAHVAIVSSFFLLSQFSEVTQRVARGSLSSRLSYLRDIVELFVTLCYTRERISR